MGLFVIAGSLVLMAFFPWIFAKAQVPLIYAYGTFIAFLISALLGYFVNYKMIVLSADQKQYKITIETQGIKVIKIFAQMLAISMLSQGYIWWMALEALGAILTSVRLAQCVKREYPWLNVKNKLESPLREKYTFILRKTKQIFFHKASQCVLTYLTPLIIYTFTSLQLVAIYGNYLIIMEGCLMLINLIFQGFNAGIGGLVVEGNREKIKNVFWSLLALKVFVAGGICLGLYILSTDFVSLWVGQSYALDQLVIFLMSSIYFIQMSRTSDFFISAYGLFHDVWAPVIEASLNLSLSIFLGWIYGLHGILLGVLISQVAIVNSWKPFFLYKQGFNGPIMEFVHRYTKKIFLLIFTLIVVILIENYFDVQVSNFLEWSFKACLVVLFYFVIGFCLFYMFDSDFRKICFRIFCIFTKQKIKS